jgi:hypothetical protein
MEKEEIRKKLNELQEQIINAIGDTVNYSNTDLNNLYKHKQYLKFQLYNHSDIKDMTEGEIKFNFQLYQKAARSRTGLKSRIKKKVDQMIHPVFITITLKDEWFTKDHRNELRKLFKKYNITTYTLISDYGKITNRLHYHGFIDIAYLDSELFEQTNIKNKSDWNFIPLNKFGHNVLRDLDLSRLKLAINYTTKYMLKDYKLNHETFSSRSNLKIHGIENIRLQYFKKNKKFI